MAHITGSDLAFKCDGLAQRTIAYPEAGHIEIASAFSIRRLGRNTLTAQFKITLIALATVAKLSFC
ncbi:hypothetical protein XA67_22105 [Comamonas thiooxydans]|nr:hypothetical protein XA67_22105 [Comamonas thiooxydans]